MSLSGSDLTVGMRVVEMSNTAIGKATTVERVGKREIRTADGRRYTSTWLAPVGSSSTWNTARLYLADDPIVASRRRDAARSSLTYKLEGLAGDLRRDFSAAVLGDIRQCVDRAYDLLDEPQP